MCVNIFQTDYIPINYILFVYLTLQQHGMFRRFVSFRWFHLCAWLTPAHLLWPSEYISILKLLGRYHNSKCSLVVAFLPMPLLCGVRIIGGRISSIVSEFDNASHALRLRTQWAECRAVKKTIQDWLYEKSVQNERKKSFTMPRKTQTKKLNEMKRKYLDSVFNNRR